MRRFFIPAAHIRQHQAIITGAEFHHLRHVVRANEGDLVLLADDQGNEHQGIIAHLSATEAHLTITTTRAKQHPSFSLTLAQGLLKGQKMDLVIEKATELGVRRIQPFSSAFTVANLPSERQTNRLERWTRIAHSAAKQSGSSAPSIDSPQPLLDLLSALPPETEKLLCYEREKDLTLKIFAQAHPQLTSLCAIVGPEGGFSENEVADARSAGVHIVGLGTSTLRAETASIVAITLCQFLWSR